MSLSLTELVSAEAFALLQPRLPEGSEQRVVQVAEERYLLAIKAPTLLEDALAGAIYRVYSEFPCQDVLDVAQKVAPKLKAALLSKRDLLLYSSQFDRQFEQLERAFIRNEYRGTAPTRFRAYVERCWKEYQRYPNKYTAPIASMVQSSGFGKSRLIRELALTTSKEEDASMGVLYTCRRPEGSSGYPLATRTLQQWLFGANQSNFTPLDQLEATLVDRLVTMYIYAQEHWHDGRRRWLDLFTLQSPTLEQDISLELKKLERELRGSLRGWEAKCEAFARDSAKSKRLLLLTMDEAGMLLSSDERVELCSFRLLGRALSEANYRIASPITRSKGFTGGIFGVLLDTNAKAVDLAAPVSSSRNSFYSRQLSFPPFVLSDTTDVFWHVHDILSTNSTTISDSEIAAYKAAIRQSDGENWEHLVKMGRPLWTSIYDSTGESKDVLRLAARKLVLGCDPDDIKSCNNSTMFGVASMLSRLGLRLRSSSPLAPRFVADFMAVLAYVNCQNDGYVVSYASDPVLSLGAAYVWHSVGPVLHQCILPQLKKLLVNEEVVTRGAGEVVACIVFLLAMDACVMNKENKSNTTRVVNHRTFRGQFVSVGLFMETLVLTMDGVEIPVKEEGNAFARQTTRIEFQSWRLQWDDWQLGFSHFVPLGLEPNEDTLWFLLGRYAAGIFTHNQNGVYLVIPMVRKTNLGAEASHKVKCESADESTMDVSMILVRVDDGGTELDEWTAAKLSPVHVLCPENPLHQMPCNQVIRVCVSLQDVLSEMVYAERIERDRPTQSHPTVDVAGAPTRIEKMAPSFSYAFTYRICPLLNPKIVDATTAMQLMEVVSLSGHSTDLVAGDLSLRRQVELPVIRGDSCTSRAPPLRGGEFNLVDVALTKLAPLLEQAAYASLRQYWTRSARLVGSLLYSQCQVSNTAAGAGPAAPQYPKYGGVAFGDGAAFAALGSKSYLVNKCDQRTDGQRRSD